MRQVGHFGNASPSIKVPAVEKNKISKLGPHQKVQGIGGESTGKSLLLPMYRRNVACIFESNGKVLLGRRTDCKAWQFPQGGVDEAHDHTEEQALYREMHEELGTRDFEVVTKHPQRLKYDFPPTVKPRGNFVGQEQRWFLARFTAFGDERVPEAGDLEFEAFEWVSPAEALERVVHFKREIYLRVLEDFGLMEAQHESVI